MEITLWQALGLSGLQAQSAVFDCAFIDLRTNGKVSYFSSMAMSAFKISPNLVFNSDEQTGSSCYSLRPWNTTNCCQRPVPLLALTLPIGPV